MALVRNREAWTRQGEEDTGEEAYGEKIIKKKCQYYLTTNGMEREIRDLKFGVIYRFFRR